MNEARRTRRQVISTNITNGELRINLGPHSTLTALVSFTCARNPDSRTFTVLRSSPLAQYKLLKRFISVYIYRSGHCRRRAWEHTTRVNRPRRQREAQHHTGGDLAVFTCCTTILESSNSTITRGSTKAPDSRLHSPHETTKK